MLSMGPHDYLPSPIGSPNRYWHALTYNFGMEKFETGDQIEISWAACPRWATFESSDLVDAVEQLGGRWAILLVDVQGSGREVVVSPALSPAKRASCLPPGSPPRRPFEPSMSTFMSCAREKSEHRSISVRSIRLRSSRDRWTWHFDRCGWMPGRLDC